jgi:hypothetical protein
MRVYRCAVAAVLLVLAVALAPAANAGDEFADAEITIKPISGSSFFNDAFSAAEGTVKTAIRLPGPAPEYPRFTPMKVAEVGLPPSGVLTFNPRPSMPVCPDSRLGPPPTTNSVPVPVMIARCPKALIGNGTAVFALAQLNSPSSARDGEILIFNGGRVGGLPRIKVYAYSYEIEVGIYTSAILQPDGKLRFEIPYLPVDSAVTEIELSIPGRRITRPKPGLGLTVKLPRGLDPDYIRVKCTGDGGLPWTTELTLGTRDVGSNPTGPESVVGDSGNTPCAGVPAAPRLTSFRASGPARAVRNRPVTFAVRVRNAGPKAAIGGRLVMTGRGVRRVLRVGSLAGGKTKTFRFRVKFRARGLVRAQIRLSTRNAGGKVFSRRVRVR